MSSYFNIDKVNYEGPNSKNMYAFKFYDANQKVLGKSMKDHLKFAMSWWHTLCGDGTDMFGPGTVDKSFGGRTPMEVARGKVEAGFELMTKLGIEYFCFHDVDIAPEGKTLAESQKNLDEIAALIEEKQKETGIKCLWGTSNLFSHPRFMHGAATSCCADVFAYAAAKVKKALELTVRFGGNGYVFWGGREGYETLLNTDMGFELDNLARLMKMAVAFGRSIGFTGDFYVEPKPKEPTKHQYDFDSATVISFLRKYGLDKDFKLNIEANHATLAGHTFEHELRVARTEGFFGSIDANEGDVLLGWDTDNFPTNVYTATKCMYEVIKAGGFTNGGLNFDAKTRRPSYKLEDLMAAYIAGMDTFALGLTMADKLIADGRLDAFVEERYASYKEGIGAKIISETTDLEELSEYALKMGEVSELPSGGQEYLESVINSVMFAK